MVKRIEDLNFYELLEVSPTASSQEIHRAYERVRRIYEPNSVALYSLFTPEETSVIHQRIEEAYHTLIYESHRRKYDAQLKAQQSHEELVPAPAGQPGQAVVEQNRTPAAPPPQPVPQDEPPAPVSQSPAPPSPFNAEFTGQSLKFLREQRGLTVREIADRTKISSRYLESIEAEEYRKLPARPYLRGFIGLFAKALGYDAERVTNDYLRRYDAAMNPQKK